MDIPIFRGLYTPPCRTLLFFPSQQPNYDVRNAHLFDCFRKIDENTFLRPLKLGRQRLRVNAMSSSPNRCNEVYGSGWSDSDCVQVIGIGSRVDPVLDFCLSSSSPSHCLRYWNIITNDSSTWQLQGRVQREDGNPDILEISLDQQMQFKAVLLVATAGYGDDHIIATDILRTVKSMSGLVVAIVLKPFSFEGQRRHDEVRILEEKLQDSVNFTIEIDIDTLLKMDLVTLDEALKTMNRAVFLAVTAVSVIASGDQQKHIESFHSKMKLLTVQEVKMVVETYTQGRIGFAIGSTVENSITQAVFDCPFFCTGLKDLKAVVLCIFSSASFADFNDLSAIVRTFRQLTGCTQDIIVSPVYDPAMKPNLVSTTVIAVSSAEQRSSEQKSILLKLAERIPFVFSFLRSHFQLDSSSRIDAGEAPSTMKTSATHEKMVHVEGLRKDFEKHPNELQNLLNDDLFEVETSRNYENDDEFTYSDAGVNSFNYSDLINEGADVYQRELAISWNSSLEHNSLQNWTDKGATASGPATMGDNPCIYNLPVGVRHSDDEPRSEGRLDMHVLATPSPSSWNAYSDAEFEAVTAFPYNSLASLKGNYTNVSKKQGHLSTRAASMLEAERDSEKRWSPPMEIRYRGGLYKGHCQGGLPEGRGRLTFPDGTAYDGMWHYGKRSGLGTFYFNNGDVFQGSWRDDLMHGKGWLYFHNGDRWFSHFWKGKANGEARFYSNSGEILFGCFKDGWRHGRFLCVRVDGTRYVEMWNQGVLVGSERLES